jgi:hypothetical protein
MKWVTHLTSMVRREIHSEILLKNITEKERIKLIWKDGIKSLKEIGCYDVDCCDLLL